MGEADNGDEAQGWCASTTWCEMVTTDDTKSDRDLDCETGDERGRELQCDADEKTFAWSRNLRINPRCKCSF
ncbi:uncharacterized protein DS421_13g412150 [Arachis hypogaea]|nr:uncharacterized protein DS421_13g412150 [Arachis hypogaea]